MCWILKLFCNEIFGKFDWVLHLEILQSLMIIQLLTHYTKSILKSLPLWYFKMQYSVIVKQFKNSTYKILILSRVEKMVWVLLFWVTRLDFLKSHSKGPDKWTIWKYSFARKSQMWWYERGNSGGISHGCRKRKKS